MAGAGDRQAAGAGGPAPGCPLCADTGGELVWRDSQLRVILAAEPGWPGFTRVVWQAHRAEMTDLVPAERAALMQVVYAVEAVQREVLRPDKINLACFGNVVPHLHWHVIPRWRDDSHFPEPVWGRPATGRDLPAAARRAAVVEGLPGYRARLRERLGPA